MSFATYLSEKIGIKSDLSFIFGGGLSVLTYTILHKAEVEPEVLQSQLPTYLAIFWMFLAAWVIAKAINIGLSFYKLKFPAATIEIPISMIEEVTALNPTITINPTSDKPSSLVITSMDVPPFSNFGDPPGG